LIDSLIDVIALYLWCRRYRRVCNKQREL